MSRNRPDAAVVEELPWDSEFFGIPIGRIHLEDASDESIVAGEADARRRGVLCLYGALDPADQVATYRVQELGYRFVEAATMFELRPSAPPIPRPPGIEVRLGTEDDLPALETMIDSLADWSRFSVDPRFGPESARRMQHAWVRRAAAADDDRYQLTVAEDTDGIIAFVTRRRVPDPTADAVGTTARGSGAARYLIQLARDWAAPEPLLGGAIAARNLDALRYVHHCGFGVHEVRYLYHRWLDEDGGVG